MKKYYTSYWAMFAVFFFIGFDCSKTIDLLFLNDESPLWKPLKKNFKCTCNFNLNNVLYFA
jgi:hypothetical protein